MPKARISIPPAAGPTMRLALPPTAFKAMALPSSARGTVLAIRAWRTGMLTANPVPMTKLKTMACQTRTQIQGHQQGEHHGGGSQDQLQHDQHAAAVKAIGGHAAQGTQKKKGKGTQSGRDSHDRRRTRQLPDEPTHGHLLDPEACHVQQVACPQVAIVCVAQGYEHPPFGFRMCRSIPIVQDASSPPLDD